MSRVYLKAMLKASEYGLSSDDDGGDGDEALGCGLFEDQRLNNHPHRRGSSRNRDKKWREHGSSGGGNKYSTQNSVSLADFDKDYIDYDDDDDEVRRWLPRRDESGTQAWLKSAVQWLVRSSKWKVALIGLLLGLGCAVVYKSYTGLRSSSSGNPSLHSSTDGQQIPVDPVIKQVHKRAGQFECGVKGVLSRDIKLEELIPEKYSLNSEEVLSMLTMIQRSPELGVRWLDEQKNPISESSVRFPSPNDVLRSVQPYRTISCQLRQTVGAVWDQLKMIFMFVAGILVVVAVVRWYVQTKENEMRRVYMMVDRILDVLKKHHENTRHDKHLLPYLAIIHVRDVLIPPSERKRSVKIWEKACQWLAEHESRVRVENQRIAGEDFEVWRWIQIDPLQTEVPWSVTGTGGEGRGEDTTDGVKSKKKGDWLGTAFEDYPPGVDVKVAPPAGSPSPFIRLKNMFEATKHMDDEMANGIEDSVLERCSPHGDVVHVYIDRRSPFGCVYLKMDSLQSAKGAYKALHGGWYRGKLVTAKYIPESKYYKWFPKAALAKTALTPSSSSSS